MPYSKRIYLDYAAATPIDERVLELMTQLDQEAWGNASSPHATGRRAYFAVEDARQKIGEFLRINPETVIFTASGTESDNLAVLGVALANQNRGKHIITSVIEHYAVLNACKQLETEGFELSYLPVNKSGIVDIDDLKSALRPDTVLVSIMQANNEIGTIQPISKMVRVVQEHRKQTTNDWPYFHTDACSAVAYLDSTIASLGVDLLSISGSKIYGPKGVGVLAVKKSVNIVPIFFGGDQERGLRPGTQSPTLIAGLAKALEITESKKASEIIRLTKLRDYAIEKIVKEIPKATLNGDASSRLPNNINVSFHDVDRDMLVLKLSQKGIDVSTGSACTTSENGPSHVIQALDRGQRIIPSKVEGFRPAQKNGNLRVTLGRETTKKDLDTFIDVLKQELANSKTIPI